MHAKVKMLSISKPLQRYNAVTNITPDCVLTLWQRNVVVIHFLSSSNYPYQPWGTLVFESIRAIAPVVDTLHLSRSKGWSNVWYLLVSHTRKSNCSDPQLKNITLPQANHIHKHPTGKIHTGSLQLFFDLKRCYGNTTNGRIEKKKKKKQFLNMRLYSMTILFKRRIFELWKNRLSTLPYIYILASSLFKIEDLEGLIEAACELDLTESCYEKKENFQPQKCESTQHILSSRNIRRATGNQNEKRACQSLGHRHARVQGGSSAWYTASRSALSHIATSFMWCCELLEHDYITFTFSG